MTEARARIRFCSKCGALSEREECDICGNPRREPGIVCVVEHAVDILSIEKSGTFNGKYHVLGGKISPLNGTGPEDLRISELEARFISEPIREVVIALGSDVEGDATSYYLSKRLSRPNVRITRIAHGLPAGTGLEFADEVTLSRALEGRHEIKE